MSTIEQHLVPLPEWGEHAVASLLATPERAPKAIVFATQQGQLAATIALTYLAKVYSVKLGELPSLTNVYVAGNSPDRQITVEEILDAIELLRVKPIDGSSRHLYIHASERLNTQSQGALLRIMEEPPSHLSFVLSTESIEKHALPILSRCVKPRIQVPTKRHLLEYLRTTKQLSSEQLQHVEKLQFSSIDGAVRLAEQSLDVSGKVEQFCQHMWRKETGPALLILEENMRSSEDNLAFIDQLIDFLHRCAMGQAKSSANRPPTVQLPPPESCSALALDLCYLRSVLSRGIGLRPITQLLALFQLDPTNRRERVEDLRRALRLS